MLMASMIMPLVSCNDDAPVLTQKDWNGTATYFSSTDEKTFQTFYQPYVGYVGDPMPFYDPVSEDFKIMYLQDFRPNPDLTYHPIWAVSTKDLSSYTSMGELIPYGSANDVDAAIGTGSTIYNEEDKLYYTFYTGHTPSQEVIMLATSPDFKTWTKNRNLYLRGEDYGYDVKNFRDPFVFKGDDGKYHMIVSANIETKGNLVEFTSTDLLEWHNNGVFMKMLDNRFYECPDIFKMGEWWYMIYSEKLATVRKVQYFKGRTLDELKNITQNVNMDDIWPDNHEGFLDSRAFYAGKTASNGTDRYIWGWCPTRKGNSNIEVSDKTEPEWAGALVAHKIIQHQDGTLTLGAAEGIASKYNKTSEIKVMSQSESGVQVNDGNYSLSSGSYTLFNRLNTHNKITFKVTASSGSDKFGFSFCRGTDSEKFYSIIVSPESNNRNKLNFEEEGGKGFILGADSYFFDTPADNTYNVTILTDNSVCVVYINDVLAYTNRIYGMQKNCWSINCYDGSVTVSDINVMYY